MMAYAVHLMVNAVHPSGAPDVNDGRCSTPIGKYSTQSEAPDLHDRICSILDGKSNAGKRSTPKRGS